MTDNCKFIQGHLHTHIDTMVDFKFIPFLQREIKYFMWKLYVKKHEIPKIVWKYVI